MPDIARAALTCVVVAVAILGSSCARPPSPTCGCMTLDAAVRGVERVSARDWQKADRAALERDWPEAVPCNAGSRIGLQAAADAIARCCEACEVCGAADSDTDSPGAGLRAVELWICPRPSDGQQAALRKLARAAAATREPVGVSRSGDLAIEAYTWTTNGASFMLTTNAVETRGAWLGHFRWGRCQAQDAVESWRVDGDHVVSVTQADVEHGDGGEAALRFAYVSTCLVQDGACRDRELDRLWPSLRARAEQDNVSAIHISTEDCTARSLTFHLDRAPDGRSTGGPWAPRDR